MRAAVYIESEASKLRSLYHIHQTTNVPIGGGAGQQGPLAADLAQQFMERAQALGKARHALFRRDVKPSVKGDKGISRCSARAREGTRAVYWARGPCPGRVAKGVVRHVPARRSNNPHCDKLRFRQASSWLEKRGVRCMRNDDARGWCRMGGVQADAQRAQGLCVATSRSSWLLSGAELKSQPSRIRSNSLSSTALLALYQHLHLLTQPTHTHPQLIMGIFAKKHDDASTIRSDGSIAPSRHSTGDSYNTANDSVTTHSRSSGSGFFHRSTPSTSSDMNHSGGMGHSSAGAGGTSINFSLEEARNKLRRAQEHERVADQALIQSRRSVKEAQSVPYNLCACPARANLTLLTAQIRDCSARAFGSRSAQRGYPHAQGRLKARQVLYVSANSLRCVPFDHR